MMKFLLTVFLSAALVVPKEIIVNGATVVTNNEGAARARRAGSSSSPVGKKSSERSGKLRGSSKNQSISAADLRQRILSGLFEGDIIPDYDSIVTNYGIEVAEELEAEGILDPSKSNDSQKQNNPVVYDESLILQNVVPDRRWDNRIQDVVHVPYELDSRYTSAQVNRMKIALKELGDRTGVVKFVLRKNERDYIYVNKGSGCSSYVGKQGGEQEVTLQSYCAFSKGVTQHEFMHALGLFHEQSRPDRDQYVQINWRNIDNNREHNFKKKNDSSTFGNPYDYGSVMHYPKDAFSKNGSDTITPTRATNGKIIGQRNEADDQDIIDIRLLYQCVSGPRNLSQYNSKRCSSDCKCWEGESGCNGQNNACQGSLVCSRNNQCVRDNGGGGGGSTERRFTSAPSPSPRTIPTTKKWRFIKNEGNNCLTVEKERNNNVAVYKCFQGNHNTQKWIYNEKSNTIKSLVGGRPCLTWVHDGNGFYDVKVRSCTGERNQKWYMNETVNGSTILFRTEIINMCLSKSLRNLNALLKKCTFAQTQRFQLK